VGAYLGNGGAGTQARLRAYDAGLNLIGEVNDTVHTPVTEFLGIQSMAGGIRRIRIDYPLSSLAEEIDNLVFDSCAKEPIPPPPPTTPFSLSGRAVGVSWESQDPENANIVLTPLDGVQLTINGVGHLTPYDWQIARNANINLIAPVVAFDNLGRRLVFHHWRMDEFLLFPDGRLAIQATADHNATFTAVYYQTIDYYLPTIGR
jgi:hypothetical protein